MAVKQPDYSPDDVNSAHEKLLKKFLGQGGVIFTPAERAALDANVYPEKPLPIDN